MVRTVLALRPCNTYDRMIMPPHVRDWTPTGFRCVVLTEGPKAGDAK